MKTKADVLKYILTTKDRGFTHKPVKGIDVKMNIFHSIVWRLEIFFHLVVFYIKREIRGNKK